MAVISIHETTFDDQRVYVEATVEDMVLVHAQTMLDPAEYGPALCEASFAVDPEVPFPHDGAAFLRYVDDLDLNWKVIDTSDRYLDCFIPRVMPWSNTCKFANRSTNGCHFNP